MFLLCSIAVNNRHKTRQIPRRTQELSGTSGDFFMTFGARLKIIAKKHFKTQRLMAEALGMGEDMLTDYIRDRNSPGASFLERLARLDINGLRININWLLVGDGSKLVPKQDGGDRVAPTRASTRSETLSELRTVLQRAEELVDDLE